MSKIIYEIDKLYEEMLSHKRYLFEQVTQTIFGDAQVTLDKTNSNVSHPTGWNKGVKYIFKTDGSVKSPIDGIVLAGGALSDGKYYYYLESGDKNQIYIGNLTSMTGGLKKGQKITKGTELGRVSADSFVYIASKDTPINNVVSTSGLTSTSKTYNPSGSKLGEYMGKKVAGLMNVQEQRRGRGNQNNNDANSPENNQRRGRGNSEPQGNGEVVFEPGIIDNINDVLKKRLEKIASEYGKTITITSSQRDPKRNKKVGGAKNSAHLRANAVDIRLPVGTKDDTVKFIEIASRNDIGGIGVYKPGSVHLDIEGRRAWGPTHHRSSVPSWAEDAIQAHLEGGSGYVPTYDSDEVDDTDVEIDKPTSVLGIDLPDYLNPDKVKEELEKMIGLSNMSVEEKAKAMERLKTAGIGAALAGGAAGLYSLVSFVMTGTKTLTTDKQAAKTYNPSGSKLGEYIGSVVRFLLPN